MNITQKPYNEKYSSRAGNKIQAIVMHIADGSISAIHSWAKSSGNVGSSWHFAISKKGEIFSYCPEDKAAWHAGIKWEDGIPYNAFKQKLDKNLLAEIVQNKKNINPIRYSIGIEHEGKSGEIWTKAMYDADVKLILYLSNKYDIPINRKHIIGHNEIDYKMRKSCPGRGLDWKKLFNLLEDKTMWKEKYEKEHKKLEKCNKVNKELKSKIEKLEREIEKLNNRDSTNTFGYIGKVVVSLFKKLFSVFQRK